LFARRLDHESQNLPGNLSPPSTFRFAGGEKWSISIPLSLVAGAIFYGLFDYLLHLPFPEGTLLVWLNLFG
jgi:hypothetical protein